MFEHRSKPLIGKQQFLNRFFQFFLFAIAILVFSLVVGMAGYHFIGNLPWIDSLLNASMILTGMGPVDKMTTASGKLFSSFYAIYSGLAFLTVMAVFLAPVVHRFLHKMHIEEVNDR